MTVLYVTYTIRGPAEDRALAIHLRQEGTARPTHEVLRELHGAVDAWTGKHPADLFVHADLGVEPEAEATRMDLTAYLYASGAVNRDRLGRHLSMLFETGRIHRFAPRPGGMIEGPDLVGRQEKIEALRKRLTKGSVHLMAPRRYGKTSVLRHLTKVIAASGEPCLFVDVSPGPGPSWFLVTLVQEAMKCQVCRKAVSDLPELAGWPGPGADLAAKSNAGRKLEEQIGDKVWSFGQRLLEELGRIGAVLLVDEFSVFLRKALRNRPGDAKALCELLARSRAAATPTRQVLAGSAGLSSYLHFHDLASSLADLEEIDLPPLEPEEAAVLAEELLYGERQVPSPEIVAEILAVVGEPIPYFIHALVAAVCDESHATGTLDAASVGRAYQEMLGPRGNGLFKDYILEYQPYPESLRKAASRMLRELAREPEGLPELRLRALFLEVTPADEARYEPLLSCLREDYDLEERDGRWRMRSKVLRDRWCLGEPWLTGAEG